MAPPPILRYAAAQGVAFGLIMAAAQVPAIAGMVSGWGWVAVDAGLAALLCLAFRLPWWWLPVAAAMPFAVAAASGSDLPWWAWLGGLSALLLIYGGGIATRVPLYLSNPAAVEHLARIIPPVPGARACDLGAGLGGPMSGLARLRPDLQVVGVEASLLPWLACRLRCLRRRNVRAVLGDIFAHDLGPYQTVYAFLSPAPMPRLWAKACAEMAPGSLLVSNTFTIPGAVPEQTIVLPGRSDARLYVYRLPG